MTSGRRVLDIALATHAMDGQTRSCVNQPQPPDTVQLSGPVLAVFPYE